MIKARALYGLKSSGAAWREKLAENLTSLRYKLSKDIADVWMNREFNPNGDPYYKYMLCYFDDLIHICFNPKEDMDALNMIYRLMEGFGTPDQYLGENVDKVQLKDGRVVWSTDRVDCLKSAMDYVDNSLGVDKTALKKYGDGHRPY